MKDQELRDWRDETLAVLRESLREAEAAVRDRERSYPHGYGYLAGTVERIIEAADRKMERADQ